MIPFLEAYRLVISNTPIMGSEPIALENLIGRVLAEPIYSPLNLPIFTNSAVDGYAVRSVDTPSTLNVVGQIPAGSAPDLSISSHEAARVFTGSMLPSGCDAVVMQEEVQAQGTRVVVSQAVDPGTCIRNQGEEVKIGELVFDASNYLKPLLITPAVLGVLASLGVTSARVHKQPRVSVLGTGTELVAPGQKLAPGQIYESNTRAVSAAVKLAGGSILNVQTFGDEKDAIESGLKEALSVSDVVITCGGVSVGDHDLVRECALRAGVKEVFWRVNIRPGKPVFFGLGAEGQLVFGLPGNPVSALLAYLLYVRPCLKKMVGLNPNDPGINCTIGCPIQKRLGRYEVVRAVARRNMKIDHPKLILMPTEGQSSHMLTGLANADHLIWLNEEIEALPAYADVRASRIMWELDNASPQS